MDPIQFVRDQLGGPTVGMEEFRDLQQNVKELNEDVHQIKTEIAKITSALSKFIDSCDAPTDGPVQMVVCDHHNESSQSMENNVGDSNHASLLNDSDVFDNTADQTVINVQVNDLSTEEQHNKITGAEYTMEFVEVEVVCQANDSFQGDTSFANSTIYASQSKIALPNGNGSITFGDFGESQSDELCDGIVADQSSSPESIAVANGASHAENVEMVIKDVHANDADPISTECEMASTPKKLDTNSDDVDSKMDVNIEDLPIDIDDPKDQP